MNKQESVKREELEALRREYAGEELNESSVDPDPVQQFAVWFEQALASELLDPNAMSLATAGSDGTPSVRIVLLKGFDQQGFRFYTNYKSAKGKDLAENPNAAACFYWAPLDRQVRVQGTVEKLSRDESEEYFQQRPRLSQLGAWSSIQSSEIASRDQLIARFRELEEKFSGQMKIPMPDFWGGYLIKPMEVEFWQGRPGRLHDRLLYSRMPDGWKISRLSP